MIFIVISAHACITYIIIPLNITYCTICSILLYIAHLHHMYEKIKNGNKFLSALFETLIQATYTYIFGYISAIFFTRTGMLLYN